MAEYSGAADLVDLDAMLEDVFQAMNRDDLGFPDDLSPDDGLHYNLIAGNELEHSAGSQTLSPSTAPETSFAFAPDHGAAQGFAQASSPLAYTGRTRS